MKKGFSFFLICSFLNGSAQNVGIGTTSPKYNLHVHQSSGPGSADVSINVTNSITGDGVVQGARLRMVDNNFDIINYQATGTIGLTTLGIQRLLIKPNGNIGINNTDPQTWLQVTGSASNSEVIRLTGSTPYQTFYDGSNYRGYIQAWTDALGIGATTGNALRFYTQSGVERMTILDNGNVGIGESNPAAKLEVNGFSRFGSAAESAPKIKMKTLTGATAATEGGFVQISHDLDASKIIGVTVLVERSGGQYYPSNHTSNIESEFDYYFDSTRFEIINKPGNSGFILNRPVKIFIIYEE